MGKATGDNKNLSGKIGTKIYLRRKDGTTVVYEAPDKKATPTRSEEQMRVRMQWSNLGAVHTQFRKTLKKGFQELPAGLSDYNAFVQANVGVCKVYIPKQVRLNGGCVLAPYLVTRGKLSSIAAAKNGDSVLVTDVALGGLVINETTTVAELSGAVLAYNPEWEEGDQMTFFYGVQTIDGVTDTPRAKIQGWKVLMDTGDTETLLWNVVSALGFSSVGGYLAMGAPITDGAAVWVHSREGDAGSVQVSTQYLFVDSSVLAGYQTNAAFQTSADSYGGINTDDAFLDPRSTRRRSGSNQNENVNSGGGNNGNSNVNENENQGGGGTNTNPSNPTNTVAAPTLSGATQFTETTQVTMSGPSGATIHYTTDGSEPTSASTVYSAPLTLSATTTVKAIAEKDGVSSSVTSRVYTKMSGGGAGDGGDDGNQ